MKIEYKTLYMKLNQENDYKTSTIVFIPDSLTYPTKKIQSMDDAPGIWVDIDTLGDDGWELVHIVPKHLVLVGLFKRIIIDIDIPHQGTRPINVIDKISQLDKNICVEVNKILKTIKIDTKEFDK